MSIRLEDLGPKWVTHGGRRVGVSFKCPCCQEQYMHVMFRNPVDGGPPFPEAARLWERTGEDFDDLTLSPSVDASVLGHWHGFIRNGMVVSC